MKISHIVALAATIWVTATGFALAHDYTVGDLTLAHPMAFETAVTAQTAAGYLMITNTGDTPDRLIAARADFPRVEIHESTSINDVMTMRHLEDGLIIPAGGIAELAPGGAHIMFMGLPAPFVEGQQVPVTLVFEVAGEVDVIFNIETRSQTEHNAMDHDTTQEVTQ